VTIWLLPFGPFAKEITIRNAQEGGQSAATYKVRSLRFLTVKGERSTRDDLIGRSDAPLSEIKPEVSLRAWHSTPV
jgi:hypothetical protein